jgi:hypothetical protein
MAEGVSWDNFRRRNCGKNWWDFISTAYHHRCVYCDHNPARTIDHVKPKARARKTQYGWGNWRAACGDCNRLKGTKKVFDPAVEDPRLGLVFDLDMGAVAIRGGARGIARDRARASLEILERAFVETEPILSLAVDELPELERWARDPLGCE